MNAREVIVLALTPFSHLPERDASYVIGTLKENGFTIMSKEDVEAVRDKDLDRASEAALAMLINDTDSNPRLAAKVENAIRSIKSKEGKVDS